MAQTIRIIPSISLIVSGGDTITLAQMQSFIDQAKSMGVGELTELKTSITAPYGHDQRDRSPGSFTITANPEVGQST